MSTRSVNTESLPKLSNNKTVTVFATSRPGCFNLGEITVNTLCRQTWMGFTAGLDDLKEEKFVSAGNRTPFRRSCSQQPSHYYLHRRLIFFSEHNWWMFRRQVPPPPLPALPSAPLDSKSGSDDLVKLKLTGDWQSLLQSVLPCL